MYLKNAGVGTAHSRDNIFCWEGFEYAEWDIRITQTIANPNKALFAIFAYPGNNPITVAGAKAYFKIDENGISATISDGTNTYSQFLQTYAAGSWVNLKIKRIIPQDLNLGHQIGFYINDIEVLNLYMQSVNIYFTEAQNFGINMTAMDDIGFAFDIDKFQLFLK
jgi:hypothetical protein